MRMRWAPLAMVLGGCLHPSSLTCPGPDGTSWVCPADLACAQPPTYCGTTQEVGACDGKAERDPCSTNLVPDGLCISSVCEACSNDIAGCRSVGWLAMTSPTTVVLHAIAFTQFGEAYAGGDDGTLFHYLNAGWEADSRFTYGMAGVAISSVSAAGGKVYALLGANKVYVLANGSWAPLPMNPGQTYKAMWAAPSGDVFLVGPNGNVGRWNGTSWTEGMSGPSFNAVWGTSANDVYAVGTAASIYHYDGAVWSPVTNPGSGVYTAVFGAGGEVFAAGASIVHGSGAAFTATTSPIAFTVRGLWGSADDDMFAVGDNGTVIHWDGVAWTQMQASTSTLNAIAGSRADEIFAVGDGGTISRYTGAAWAIESSPGATMPLLDIAALGPDEALAVGSEGVFHLGGTGTWSHDLTTMSFSAVAARSPTDAVVVGSNTSELYNGSTWSVGGGGFGTAADVWPWTSSYALVSDDVFTRGSTWAPVIGSGGVPSTRGLWVAPSNRFWLAGAGILHVDGSTVTTDVSTGTYNSIWGAGEADVFAAGVGTIQHYDGTAWTAMTVPTTSSLAGLWGRAGDDVFAVGSSNTVLHYHAGLWQQFTTPFSGDLTSVSGAGASIYMTAKDGKVHRLIDTAP